MPWVPDPKTGKVVYRSAENEAPETAAPPPAPEGKVQLVDNDGTVFEADQSWVDRQVKDGVWEGSGFQIAKPADVHRYVVAERNKGTGKALEAAAVAAERGAIDATIALPKLATALGSAALGTKDPLHDVSGGQFLEDIGALANDDPVAGANQARRIQQDLAEGSPTATTVGEIGGQIAGSLPMGGAGGLAKGLGAKVALGAVEGGGLSLASAGEDAYIKDQELTRDQMLAAVGVGALLGGGITLGAEKAARLFRRSGSRGSTALDSPRDLGPYRSLERAPDYDALAKRALGGVEPAPGMGVKLRDAVESAQSAITGTERDTLKKYGAMRWDNEARAGRDLWRRRDEILEGATRDLTDDFDTLVTQRKDVFDEVADARLKRSNVRPKLTGDTDQMLAAARAETGRLRAELQAVAIDAEQFGNKALVKNTRKLVRDLAESARATDDPAQAFIVLDQAKRALQRERVSLGRSAIRQPDALKARQAYALGDKLADLQEGTRRLLMDEAVWGEAALDQKAINAAWEEWFASRQLFEKNVLTRVGETFEGKPIFRADSDRVSSYLGRLGREQGKLADEQIRHHVIATQRLADAIDGAFDLGEKRAIVQEVRKAAEKIGRTLDKADNTIKVANQIDAVMAADKGMGGVPGAVLGGIVGGAPGAALGAIGSALTKPGAQIRMLAAVEAMTQNVDSHIAKSFRAMLTDGIGPISLPPIRGAKRALSLGTIAGSAQFAKEGEEPKEAYRRRVKETLAYVNNIRGTTDQLATATQELASPAPKLAGNLSLGAIKSMQWLASRIPAGAIKVDPFAPGGVREVSDATDEEIAQFRADWELINNPLGVLHDMRRGLLTFDQVAALKQNFMPLFQRMQIIAREEIASSKKEMDYEVRTQMDLLLDLNGAGEPALSPSFQALLGTVSQMTDAGGPPAPPGGGAGPGGGRPSNPKLSERFQTLGASLEAGGGG